MNDLLQVDAVSRRYPNGQVQALDAVSFSARPGEMIALTGPSGCGKSTLLGILGLLDQPDSGCVRFQGEDLARVRRAAAFRASHIGFVFQFHFLVPTMTLQENVEAPLLALGVPRAERHRRAVEGLASVGLAARKDFLPAHVSGGERQRAAVARAIVTHPPLILADEPTGNLDSRSGTTVADLLAGRASRDGALVIMATHNAELAAVASRRIAMLDGRIVRDSAARHGTDPAIGRSVDQARKTSMPPM